jgi:ubiquinone/menaquinone biosynthesis C-methylase UbiE
MDYETEYVKNVYNIIASEFDKTRYNYWNSVKKFIDAINKSENKKILDLGCGNGKYIKLFENLTVYALDNSIELLNIVKTKYPNIITIEADVCNTCLQKNMFDYIISIAVIHHLKTEERRINMIKEIYRLLKHGGCTIISAWATTTPTSKFTKLDTNNNYLVPWKNKYTRFYHLFEINEFENLIIKSGLQNLIIIKDIIFECDNWIIILEKI